MTSWAQRAALRHETSRFLPRVSLAASFGGCARHAAGTELSKTRNDPVPQSYSLGYLCLGQMDVHDGNSQSLRRYIIGAGHASL